MRSYSIVLIFSILSITSAQASDVELKSINNSKATATIHFPSATRAEVNYEIQAANDHANYAVMIYEKGDCTNFSEPVPIQVLEKESGKQKPYNFQGSAYFLFYFKHISNGHRWLAGGSAAAEGDNFTFKLKDKILVLVEVENSNSTSASPVACGIHP